MNGVERPLDLLNNLKGQNVKVKLKGKDEFEKGILLAFDIHINLVLEDESKKPLFIRGDIIEIVYQNN